MSSKHGAVFSPDRTVKVENTIFGWVIGGSLFAADVSPTSTCLKLAPTPEPLDQLLQQFWEMEKVPGKYSSLTANEQLTVVHFQDTHSRTNQWKVSHQPTQEGTTLGARPIKEASHASLP